MMAIEMIMTDVIVHVLQNSDGAVMHRNQVSVQTNSADLMVSFILLQIRMDFAVRVFHLRL